MTRHETSGHVQIHKEVGPLLMLRSNVAPLFRKIADLDQTRVILDFSDVEFMSRSFADEYLSAKAASKKTIEEHAVPLEVRRMLRIVTNQLASRSPADAFNRRRPRTGGVATV